MQTDPSATSVSIGIDEISKNVRMFAEIFQNEYLFSYTLQSDKIRNHIEYLSNVDLLRVDEKEQAIVLDA